jgi:hypothetical protein
VGRHGLAAALAVLLSASALQAQEPKPPERDGEKSQAPQKVRINGAHSLSWTEGDQTVFFFTGGVTMERPDSTLRAARIMAWKNASSGLSFDEIYAEGNVIFTRGVHQINCERFFYSAVTDQGAVVDVRLKGYSKDLKTDFFMMAKEARMKVKAGEMEADEVRLSSCPYGVPHYHLSMNHASLQGKEIVGDKKLGFDPGSWTFDFDALVPEFSGIPFFYLPGLSVGPWLMNFPFRSAHYGHTSRFGSLVYLDFGSRIRLVDDQGKLKQWGDVDLKVDWREIRGIASGIDFTYKWDNYSGRLDSYYLHDQGRMPGSAFDASLPPLTNPDRGKVHWFHRQDLDDHWRYELESYYLTDRSLLQEFFPAEFKELKEPESAVYVRWMDGNLSAYALGRFRLNGFQTEDEYLPRLDFNLLSEPILGGLLDNLYLTERVDVVDIRHRSDDALALPDVATWRADAVTELALPFDFRYFQVAPYFQDRFTLYEKDVTGATRERNLLTTGARLTTQVHATHPDVYWERVGIRGLRHVMELEVRYANTFSSNVNPADLFPFEPVDSLGRFEEVSFELRQRLLTKDSAGRPFEFLTLMLGIEYYPSAARDTIGANPNNQAPPFSWIPVLSQPFSGSFPRRLWSDFYYEFSFHPRDFFAVNVAGEYNPVTRAEEVREMTVTFTPSESFTGSVGQELIRGVANAFTVGMTWAVTPKWSISVIGEFDFKSGGYLRQELVVARDFHDFSIEAGYERDMTRDENRFMISLVPKFLGNAGLRSSHLYRPGMKVEAPTDR